MKDTIFRVILVGLGSAALIGWSYNTLPGFTRPYDRPVTPWLKTRIWEPTYQSAGWIELRPRGGFALYTQVSDQWVKLTHESLCGGIIRLYQDQAVLFWTSENTSEKYITYQGQKAVRPLSEVAPCSGIVRVSPAGDRLDCVECLAGDPSKNQCRVLSLKRYDLVGHLLSTTTLHINTEQDVFPYSEVFFYGRANSEPYFLISQGESSLTQCGLLEGSAERQRIYRFQNPVTWMRCADPAYWSGIVGHELSRPKWDQPFPPARSEPIRAEPGTVMQPVKVE